MRVDAHVYNNAYTYCIDGRTRNVCADDSGCARTNNPTHSIIPSCFFPHQQLQLLVFLCKASQLAQLDETFTIHFPST